MEIEQFRVTVKARDFERTCRFYGETLALSKAGDWDRADWVGRLFQAGPGTIEVVGRAPGSPRRPDDAVFEYRGPDQKLVIHLVVPSPQEAYDELIFRNQNVPGGMREEEGGTTVFETHDPDGVRIVFRAAGE
jgi:catechol 2,3-dioxygenase-like lactoylglutathione lyase family enzyme